MTEQSKVAPVEAQAVPDLPVAWMVSGNKEAMRPFCTQESAALWIDDQRRCGSPYSFDIEPLFTRPTPAAADLHQQIHSVHLAGDEAGRTSMEGGVNAPEDDEPDGPTPAMVDAHRKLDELIAAQRAALPTERELFAAWYAGIPRFDDRFKDAMWRGWKARGSALVAASPAAVAEMSTSAGICLQTSHAVDQMSTSAGSGLPTETQHHAALQRIGHALGLPAGTDLHQQCVPAIEALNRASLIQGATSLNQGVDASSPVAPVGAPTEADLTAAFIRNSGGPNPMYRCVHCGETEYGVRNCLRDHWLACKKRNGQGCELATDATKQLREPSVHLAVNDAGQDFRMRPASSEAAPSAEGSGAKP